MTTRAGSYDGADPFRAGSTGAGQIGAAAGAYPISSPAFDWTMGCLSALLTVGLVQDGWAHAHGQVDQSFFTPWHAILYASMALNGLVLGISAVRNLRLGYAFRRTLPYGYWLALAGVLLFAVGGVADLGWHEVFGIETGIDALLSPSHLVLALAAALIFTGPLRSVARQYGPQTGGWKRVGPVVPALFAVVVLLGFFTDYAQPIEDGVTAASVGRAPGGAGPAVASVYSISGRDGALRRLELPAGLDVWGIALAPDGRIAYRAQAAKTADLGGLIPSDIYVAHADGSGARRITHSGRHDTQVAWSPDGSQLAYVSMPAGTAGNFQLDVVDAGGGARRTLVDQVTTLETPAWSPDGKQIVFASRNGTTPMLAVVDIASARQHWLTFTHGASAPVWTKNGLIYAGDDGALHAVALDGTGARTVAAHGDSPAISPNGAYLAYVSGSRDAAQVFVSRPDGNKAGQPVPFPGVNAQHPAVRNDGSVIFTAGARPSPEHSYVGYSISAAALLLQAVSLAGVLLLVVRRWRAPLGTFTLILPLFALAMAAQSDLYVDALAALATGILADGALWLLGPRARDGTAFYIFAFGLGGVFSAAYLIATIANSGGTAWTPNMLLGIPLITGCAALLVAFCYAPPLPKAEPHREATAFS
jgi:hypothetical protein